MNSTLKGGLDSGKLRQLYERTRLLLRGQERKERAWEEERRKMKEELSHLRRKVNGKSITTMNSLYCSQKGID